VMRSGVRKSSLQSVEDEDEPKRAQGRRRRRGREKTGTYGKEKGRFKQ
jgi:hypothetical protein